MRRLCALIAALPVDAAVRRYQLAAPAQPPPKPPRRPSSLDEIRKLGGKVIEIDRGKAS